MSDKLLVGMAPYGSGAAWVGRSDVAASEYFARAAFS
jgi:hypothetical protein